MEPSFGELFDPKADYDRWDRTRPHRHGLSLVHSNSGQVLWNFKDSKGVEWGNAMRGCPSTFQPDRCVAIKDTDREGSQEIVFAHPNKAELLCLGGADGKELWRCDLLDSAGIQTLNATSLCPIAMQEFANPDGNTTRLSVAVAPHDPKVTDSNRYLMSLDPATGNVQWQLESLQNSSSEIDPFPVQYRPLQLQWGEVEKRPRQFGAMVGNDYFDDYSTSSGAMKNGTFQRYFTANRTGQRHRI